MFDSILSLISTWGSTPSFDGQMDDVSTGNATGTADAGSSALGYAKGAAALIGAGAALRFGSSIGQGVGDYTCDLVSKCCSGK